MKDTDLLPKDKEEELKFLAMLKYNKTVSLGKVDRELYKRIAKKNARKRVPETSKNMQNSDILISSLTIQTDSAAEEYVPFQRV